MAYLKFKVKDNSYGNIVAGFSASATTINLETGDGSRFPADNFVATLVEYTTTGDATTPILGEEKILVTARSGDTLTVTRGYDGSTARSFNSGDNIYLNVTSIIIEDLQDEVTRLETDKLDISGFNSTLRNNLGNWKVIYTNGSGDETELALGSNGQFLKSNGTASAPTWEAPTVDINGLTEDNGALDSNDMLVYYNGSGNKKRKAMATNSQEGLIKLSDTSEAIERTSEFTSLSPKSGYDSFGWNIVSGATYILASADTERTTIDASFVTVKDIDVGYSGDYRISYDLRSQANGFLVDSAIFIDGTQSGATMSSSSDTYGEVVRDITISGGQNVQLRIKTPVGFGCYVRNFRIKYDLVPKPVSYLTSTVITN